MPSVTDPKSLLAEHVGWIDRVCASLCRKHGLSADVAEDFASWAKLRLVEDDYAVLRKFRGESALTTYLTVVLTMLYRDYRVSRWGRWRPSAAARRKGPVAMRLETLVYRDGMARHQAAELLRTRGEADLSDREVAALFADLPARAGARPDEVGDAPLTTIPDGSRADERVVRDEAGREQRQVESALARAVESLSTEDRVILRMRFWEGSTVADIARALRLDQKPLYRRLDKLLRLLRREMERAGVSAERVRSVLMEEHP